MEEKNNGKGILTVILSILLIISLLYIGYDKLFKSTNTTNNNSQTNFDTTGKIYVKRNGVVSLESVPSDLIGTYETKSESYFTINRDGTIYAVEGTGDGGKDIYDKSNTTFQISYIPNQEKKDEALILEIYVKTDNGWIFSPFRLGKKDSNGIYSFASFENTPNVNSFEFSYIKK